MLNLLFANDYLSIHCQLADFVRIPLEKAGGMMALVDVYCHFNRARGTGLFFFLLLISSLVTRKNSIYI